MVGDRLGEGVIRDEKSKRSLYKSRKTRFG